MVTDPRDPKIARWLAMLEPAEEFAARLALRGMFPELRADRKWTARTDALQDELRPDAEQLGAYLSRANAIRAELKVQGLEPPTPKRKKPRR